MIIMLAANTINEKKHKALIRVLKVKTQNYKSELVLKFKTSFNKGGES